MLWVKGKKWVTLNVSVVFIWIFIIYFIFNIKNAIDIKNEGKDAAGKLKLMSIDINTEGAE